MQKKTPIAYAIFMLIFLALAIYNYFYGSQWFYDNVSAMMVITLAFVLRKRIEISTFEFSLFGLVWLVHNLGTFGFYNFKHGIIAYDNFVHIVGGIMAAYIVFSIAARKLHTWKRHKIKRSVVDEHKLLFIFMVVASVILFGITVEITEYVGFMYFSTGEGMFFPGPGDGYGAEDFKGQYIDTMEDTIMNIFGSCIGVAIFYFTRYRKRPWLRR
ncbi:hypothetical protein KY349_01685 [Candidatus Woesearchaeota archaeon]|jgi:hypothetical protein|nr:hypothetical protein [Candidatus Woesearchaeota archaeon]